MNLLWVFLAAAAVIVLIKVKPARGWHEDFLSLSVSKGILGICAVLIVLHHLSQQLAENAGPLAYLENAGVCFVGLFFFFSGYGLFKSMKAKPDYFKGFFRKRMPVILIPFYVCILVFFVVFLATGMTFTGKEIAAYLTGWFLLNSHMWYIVEIAVLYLLFFLVFRFCKKEGLAIGIMTILVVLMTVGSLLLNHGEYWFQGEWWYNTTLLFIVGMLIAKFEVPVVNFAKKFYVPLLLVCAAAATGLYIAAKYLLETRSYWSEYEYPEGSLLGYQDKFMCLSCQLPMVLFFVFTLLLITMKLQFKNRILDFLGKISLELYLIHNLFLLTIFYSPLMEKLNPVSFTLIVLAGSILSAAILHTADQWLIKLVTGKKKMAGKAAQVAAAAK